MIDITEKKPIDRVAIASGIIQLQETTILKIKDKDTKKGDVLEAAKISAMNYVKKTQLEQPYCHPIPINSVNTLFDVMDKKIKVTVQVKTTAKTGVEMEALSGVAGALLTIWDMVKYLEKDKDGQYLESKITDIQVDKKIKIE